MSNERTASLSATGVSIWLDDLSRNRIESGHLAELIDTLSVVGVTTNPTIFAERNRLGRRLRRSYCERCAGAASTPDDDHRAHDRRRRGRLRHLRWRLRRDRRPRRPRLDRGLPRPRPRHRRHHRAGEGAVGQGRPRERDDQDPRDGRGPRGDLRDDRRWHQRQRHADLQPRALPPGHQRLPHRARAGPRGRSSTSRRSTRSLRSSCRASTPRSMRGLPQSAPPEATALKRQAGVANARLAYEVYETAFSSERANELLGRRARTRSGRCGRRRA